MIGQHSITRVRPDAFGAFTVREELSSSPSGATYLATDPQTDATVTVHTIEVPGSRRNLEEGVVNTLRAMSTTKVRHPSFARPLASGVAAGTPYLVYPHVAGITLDELIRQRGPQPIGEVIRILRPVASVIDAAALAGFHHGSLSPADILVGQDSIVVTRFGVVDALRHAGIDAPVQRAYASRQRQGSAPPTLADDVYSLAAIALEMMLGSPVPLSALEEDVLKPVAGVESRALQVSISRALSENPSIRPPKASEFITQLQRAIARERARRPAQQGTPAVMMMFASEESEESEAPPPPRKASPPVERRLEVTQLYPGVMSHAVAVPPARGGRSLLIASFVLIGIGAAFAAGMLMGQRAGLDREGDVTSQSSQPSSSEPAAPAPQTTALETPQEVPEERTTEAAPASAPDGQDPPPVKPPVATASRPPAAPSPTLESPAESRIVELSAPSDAPRRAVVPPNTPGSLLASSYPQGARLFVDDAMIGTTPLLLPGMSAGVHKVRLELLNFQPWSSAIDIRPNERYQLSVKLER